jgi:hypothetical protein
VKDSILPGSAHYSTTDLVDNKGKRNYTISIDRNKSSLNSSFSQDRKQGWLNQIERTQKLVPGPGYHDLKTQWGSKLRGTGFKE